MDEYQKSGQPAMFAAMEYQLGLYNSEPICTKRSDINTNYLF